MTWNARFAIGTAGAVLLTMMGMLAAEATCTSNGTNPPDGYMTATVCWLEGTDYEDPYTGRDARPFTLSIDEYNNGGSYSYTDAQARQNRVGYEAGGQSWRESVIQIGRTQYIQPLGQSINMDASLVQYHYAQADQPDVQYTYGVVNVHTSGALGNAQLYAGAQQYTGGDGCRETGQVYVQVNSSSSYTPIDEQDCVVEAPVFPDMP